MSGTASVPLRLQKGAWFIVRVHDTKKILPQAEAVPGTAIHAHLTGAGIKQFPLPMVYDNGRIRDYGTVVPQNSALNAVVSSGSVLLADKNGAAPSAQGILFQIAPAAVNAPNPLPPPLAAMFPRPTATIIHFYTTGGK